MVKERKTAPKTKKGNGNSDRDKWESEIVNTDVLVYFSINGKGEPIIQEVVAPTKALYSDLQDTMSESSEEAELCECSEFALNTDVEDWLEKFYPDWKLFVDPEFYCFICTSLKTCHSDWLEAGEDVKEKIQEQYPPSGSDKGGEGGTEEGKGEEPEEEGPSRIVLK